ncbi:restriction endonuclease subunit S [Prevotella corporis]|uniref:restriction endonuclease subunit S n=1 Tax=Prevotella corporis TaxID=28128 RepID=UPI0023F8FE22|nr:restriction endonuclease subunit S [Prevotella corporis]
MKNKETMTFIEQLLNGENVEWKKLGEVITIEKGKQLNKSLLTESGEYPAYNGGVTFSGFTDKYNYSENKIIISQGGASAGFVNFITTKFYANAHCYVVLPNISRVDNKYVYHLLKMNQENLMGKQLGAGIPALHTANILGISIPIPCPDNPTKSLDIQHRIVEILDKFTELEAELEAELDCRKRQYEYYRNQLLSFDMLNRGGQRLNDVKIMTLGEIGEIRMCKRILKGQTSTCGDVPFYKIGTFGKTPNAFISKKLFTEYKIKYSYPKIGEVLISASGTIGKTVIFDGQDAYFQDSNIVWIENDESMALNKYLYYCYQVIKWKTAEGGTINRLYNDIIKKTRIPLPPLSVQREIVEILDKFDTLTNSISEGLPKEIELRRKQYEYYRNQLLSFSTVKEKYHG